MTKQAKRPTKPVSLAQLAAVTGGGGGIVIKGGSGNDTIKN